MESYKGDEEIQGLDRQKISPFFFYQQITNKPQSKLHPEISTYMGTSVNVVLRERVPFTKMKLQEIWNI